MKKIKQFIEFIKNGIWQDNNSKKSHFLRIIVYTIRNMMSSNIFLSSAALTFYTLMSLVPIVAVIFAILKGFGFEENLTEYLYATFADYSNVLDIFLDFVNKMLAKTRGGLIAAVSVVVLLWSVIKVFGYVEDAFNSIWDVLKPRPLSRKFSVYIAIIFIAPILLVSSLSLGTIIRNALSFLNISWVVNILLWLASFVIIWALFAYIYWLMPNTKVKIKGAAIAGIIAGTVFMVFSLVYFYIQAKVSSYNAIYGTFAAVPLFLAWMQTSWQILLAGGELSFAYQNIQNYEQERFIGEIDIDQNRKILIATMTATIKLFLKDNGAVKLEDIANEINIPIRVIKNMIFELEKAGFVIETQEEDYYVPAIDIHKITVADILDKVEKNNEKLSLNTSAEMETINHLIDDMRLKIVNSDFNQNLVDLIK